MVVLRGDDRLPDVPEVVAGVSLVLLAEVFEKADSEVVRKEAESVFVLWRRIVEAEAVRVEVCREGLTFQPW